MPVSKNFFNKPSQPGGGQIRPTTLIIAPTHRFSDFPTALLAMQAAADLHDGQRRQCLCLETSSTSPLLREKKSRKVAQIQLCTRYQFDLPIMVYDNLVYYVDYYCFTYSPLKLDTALLCL